VILADTSGLLALLDRGEPRHREVRQVLAADSGPLLTIDLVLAETDFLVRSRLGRAAGDAFLDQVLGGAVLREQLDSSDLERAREIIGQFEDQEFGLTDAALMAVAERLGAPVLTLDRRHFGVFRKRKGPPLVLLP
jgi:predicted nucleic acid-binding protein